MRRWPQPDAKHADAKDGDRGTASLYDIKAPAADKPLKPAGEWNSSKVVAKGKPNAKGAVTVLELGAGSPEPELQDLARKIKDAAERFARARAAVEGAEALRSWRGSLRASNLW